MDTIPNADILNVLGHLFFVVLIDEDKHVMFGVCSIIEHPFSSWMISFVLITADGDVGRGGNVLKKGGLGL